MLSLIVFVLSVFAFAETIQIKCSPPVAGYEKTYYSHASSKWKNSTSEKITVNGEDAFCIQAGYGISGITSDGGTTNLDYATEAHSSNSIQTKIAFLGYYNTERTIKDYMFTQMMIWQSLADYPTSGNSTVKFTNESTLAEYTAWKNEITKRLNAWNTLPDFGVVKVKSGVATTVIDKNNVLKEYGDFTYNKNGVQITHVKGHNTILVQASNSKAGNVDMSQDDLVKYSMHDKTGYVYKSPNNQDLAVFGSITPVKGFNLHVEVEQLGSLKIVKTN